MAQLALLVGPAVVERKGVGEAGRFPGVGVVTGGTLPGEVIGWPVSGVAGEAVGGPSRAVVEACREPGVGVVAGRALPAKVVGRFVSGMAGEAVGCPGNGVVESGRQPGVGAVAGRALPGVVVGRLVRLVARSAVLGIGPAVIEVDLIPTGDHMAGGAVGAKLAVVGFILGMAGDTGWVLTLECGGLMAVFALQPFMPADQQEPGFAVVEFSGGPANRDVADRALGAEVSFVGVVLEVAGLAGLGGVLQHGDVHRALMALLAAQSGMFAL